MPLLAVGHSHFWAGAVEPPAVTSTNAYSYSTAAPLATSALSTAAVAISAPSATR